MGELNKKNYYVVKQIFNINNEYKLNLYEGDTLNINLKEVLRKDKFDIIIGNSPYNEELTKVGAKPLYNKFIEYYIDKCNILSYIVPSRWIPLPPLNRIWNDNEIYKYYKLTKEEIKLVNETKINCYYNT